MPKTTPGRRTLPLAALAASLALAPAHAQEAAPSPGTTPERTGYRETSRYADVVAFMEAVDRASPRVHLTTFGYTMEGRALPLAVVGDVRDASPEAVRASGKTVVYLQGSIHAGEVEGKEALQQLLREVARGGHRAWADSLVLLVAPIFNADGNERVRLDHRPHQHGPVAGMGTRNNAQDLNINRDHTKLDTPEARAHAALLGAYDPHVLVDLHTTNGTYHAYRLTYAPPMHPGTDPAIVALLRGEWLPEVTRRAKRERDWDLWYYGNVPSAESPWAAARGAERGWYTFDHRPRFSNNYWGLRNRFGILSETYSYLPFEERIDVARGFVVGVLDWAAANAGRIRRLTAEADRRSVVGEALALTARVRRGGNVEILMGAVAEERNPYSGDVMLRRLDVRRPETMPDFGTFEAAATERAPAAYLVSPALGDALDRLRAHGVGVEPLAAGARLRVEEFRIDSASRAPQASEGRHERRLHGAWAAAERDVPAGWLRVRVDQPLGRLAFILLEPRSDDGFAAWGLLDAALEGAAVYPVLREPAPAARR
ncbi:MAG TPA: M14 family metallopeptidase [Longimicrobium sp.]|nr:M14 family metallopeptidase [Longimicrobium sp.]